MAPVAANSKSAVTTRLNAHDDALKSRAEREEQTKGKVEQLH